MLQNLIGSAFRLNRSVIDPSKDSLSLPIHHYDSYTVKNFFVRFFSLMVIPAILMVLNIKNRFYEVKNTSFFLICACIIIISVKIKIFRNFK